MSHLWWYLARAAGMVAWAMLTASVLWGIVLATDLFPESRRPAWLLDLHRWLGALTVAFLGIHLVSLVADSYVSFGPTEILVPMTSSWRPWAVSLGVLAMYALVAVEVSSLAMRRLPRRTWKYIHISSYAVFVMVAFHGALAGSDATQPIYAWSAVAAIALVLAGTLYRVATVGRPRRRRSAARARTMSRPSAPVHPLTPPPYVARAAEPPTRLES